jgi:hypothetical protein
MNASGVHDAQEEMNEPGSVTSILDGLYRVKSGGGLA